MPKIQDLDPRHQKQVEELRETLNESELKEFIKKLENAPNVQNFERSGANKKHYKY